MPMFQNNGLMSPSSFTAPIQAGYQNYQQPIYGQQTYGLGMNNAGFQNNSRMSISGRVVNDESEITPSEVPMDGTVAVFPKNDGSEIIMKTWNPNGTITSVKFIPVVNAESNKDVSGYSEILDRLKLIENQISEIRGGRNAS